MTMSESGFTERFFGRSLSPTTPTLLRSSHELIPTNLVMQAIHESLVNLNNVLYSPLTSQQLDTLAQLDPFSYVKTVATEQNLRAVIRKLHQQPLELICDITQWARAYSPYISTQKSHHKLPYRY
ncbi:hypothetical protein DL93DRAFT_1648613 [Clavulina sp. PMI_390]|nr:hypothetical protein DL93DRAFT_1648613 [Clavulina sp. PMI_390]